MKYCTSRSNGDEDVDENGSKAGSQSSQSTGTGAQTRPDLRSGHL